MFGPFEKPRAGEPGAHASRELDVPLADERQHGAMGGVRDLQPGRGVRNGRVIMLYRAEDRSGEEKIGHHTSRLGIAESTDGLRFTRRETPVLYPARDAQQPNEWPGGVEDPRLVETEDGRYVLTYTQWNRRRAAPCRRHVARSRDVDEARARLRRGGGRQVPRAWRRSPARS